MKKLILSVMVAFSMSGCDLEEIIYFSSISEEFGKMCSEYDLYICDDKEKPDYTYTTYYQVRSYTAKIDYEYTRDNGDSYDYMLGDYKRGDCEDYVITLMEDLLMLGWIDNAKWVYGKGHDEYHAWLLVDFEGETKIFDTWNRLGYSYDEVKHQYDEMKIVWEYKE